VNDGVHPPDLVDLAGNGARFSGAAEITNHNPGGVGSEIGESSGTLRGACVQYDFMTFSHESARRGAAESVSRTGDEDAAHAAFL
jgi:hypothetical protein